MDNLQKPSFSFKGYLVEKAEININNSKIGKEINFSFNPRGVLNKKEGTFDLILGVNITESELSLVIDLEVKAFFTFDIDLANESLENYMIYNAPALVFPYIRAYISTLSTLSGVPTIILPTLNMSNLAPVLMKNLERIS